MEWHDMIVNRLWMGFLAIIEYPHTHHIVF